MHRTYCIYSLQSINDFMNFLSKFYSNVENGIQELVKHGLMRFLFSVELLHSNRAPRRVKHGTDFISLK